MTERIETLTEQLCSEIDYWKARALEAEQSRDEWQARLAQKYHGDERHHRSIVAGALVGLMTRDADQARTVMGEVSSPAIERSGTG